MNKVKCPRCRGRGVEHEMIKLIETKDKKTIPLFRQIGCTLCNRTGFIVTDNAAATSTVGAGEEKKDGSS